MVPHPGVPFIERLDVDEGHFPVGPSHDAIMFTADNKVNVLSKLPPAVTTRTAKLTNYKIHLWMDHHRKHRTGPALQF